MPFASGPHLEERFSIGVPEIFGTPPADSDRMSRSSRQNIVLLSAPDTMRDIDKRLESKGVQLVRIPTLRFQPIPPEIWRKSLKRTPPPDIVIVTSRTSVPLGVEPWLRTRTEGVERIRFWAAGPGTANALRAAGILRVHRPRQLGNEGIVRALRRSPPQHILHFRSDLAGPILSRRLGKLGNRVTDVVVYRVRTRTRLEPSAHRSLTHASLLVASSPSVLMGLDRSLGRVQFARLCRTAHLVVFGPRSKRAANELGFRHLSVAPSMTAQRLTRYLLRMLRDARA